MYVLPGQTFVLHRTECNALQGLFQHLVGLHIDPLGHWHDLPPPDQLQMRLLVFSPPPHVTEQALNADQ